MSIDSITSWLRAIFWFITIPTALLLLFLIFDAPTPQPTYSETIPSLPVISQLYLNNFSFIPFDAETTKLWATQIPSTNDGLVITTDLAKGSHPWADLSMFHQLRCLILIRETMVAMLESGKDEMVNDTQGLVDYDKVGHCFDYVRQGILCVSDPTVLLGPSDGGDLDGDVVWRQCRDNTLLYDWAARSAALHGKPTKAVNS